MNSKKLENNIEVKKVANGFIVSPGIIPPNRESFSTPDDTFVFNSFDDLIAWLKANFQIGKV